MRNLPHGFDIYLVNVKTMRKIAQIFVTFSEKLNFIIPEGIFLGDTHRRGDIRIRTKPDLPINFEIMK